MGAKKRRPFLSRINIFKKKSKKRAYEGAAKGKRLSRWFTSNRSADAEISCSLPLLRDRSRDLRRNNAYANKGIRVITANVIGKGIKSQIRGENQIGKKDGPVESMYKKWANSTNCDFEGRHDLLGLQQVIMDAVVESGEVLVRKRFNSSKDIPLQYQVLEADFLDTTQLYSEKANGNVVIQGVEFDKQGRRVGYHIYESHPGGVDSSSFSYYGKSNFVPASEIMHIYRMDRPGQTRGVPWLAPVMVRLKDLDDFEDAALVRQKVAACFAAFVRDLSVDVAEDEDCEDLGDKIEPGIIEFLPPGKTVDFANPPSVENYKEYTSQVLHGIAAGLGITYESLTGDLNEVNFSSARMGWIEFHRNIEAWRKHIIENLFLNPVMEDFFDVMNIMGVSTEGLTYVHTPPRREMIDPTKEVPAIIKSIRSGLTTLSDEIMAQGKDPVEQLNKIAKDNELIDELELMLDSDPRQIGLNGKAQDKQENISDGEG